MSCLVLGNEKPIYDYIKHVGDTNLIRLINESSGPSTLEFPHEVVYVNSFTWSRHCKAAKNIVITWDINPFLIPEFIMTFDPKFNSKLFNNIEWIILFTNPEVDLDIISRLVDVASVIIIMNKEFYNFNDPNNPDHPFTEPIVLIRDDDNGERVFIHDQKSIINIYVVPLSVDEDNLRDETSSLIDKYDICFYDISNMISPEHPNDFIAIEMNGLTYWNYKVKEFIHNLKNMN